MRFSRSLSLVAGCVAFWLLAVTPTDAAELYGLTPGTVQLKSAGPLSFGPSGVLFIGDAKAAKIYAINTDDKKTDAAPNYDIDDLNAKVAAAYGVDQATIADLAVNPETGNAFLSVAVGDSFGIARVTPNGTITAVNLDKIPNAAVTLPNAPEDKVVEGRRRSNPRESSITDLTYTAGRVLVAGLAAGDSPSSVREFDFPFNESASGVRVEIYHAAHGRSEDYAPIQTFVPFNIDGEASLLAGYTCTPLVKIPITKLENETKVTGTTVAELGNRNRPLDMIVYKKDGKDYVLMANSARGVMKISTDNLAENAGLTQPVSGGGVAGQPYETIDAWQGVVQLDKLSDTRALVVMEADGSSTLKSVELP
jgi:hypothetical protein